MSHNTTNTTGTGSSRNLPYALAMGPAGVRARARCPAPGAPVRRGWPLLLRVVDSRRRCRTSLLRGWVDKDHHVRLILLVNDEHALAIAKRECLDTGLCVRISRPALCEVLVCGGKFTGVNASRALGSTTTLIAFTSRLIALPTLPTPAQLHRVKEKGRAFTPSPSIRLLAQQPYVAATSSYSGSHSTGDSGGEGTG
jgi:hypothetical protein